VLVVDDDQQILDGWKRGAGRDRVVLGARDPVSARRLARANEFDLAIVDLRLGRASGIELVRDLRADVPDLLIALCSGYISVDVTVQAIRAGADAVVYKPTTFKEVLRRVQKLPSDPNLSETPSLARAEWEHMMRVLEDCNGNVSAAARRLGIFRSSLQRRLRKIAPG
jgi:two-component system response regulator RegA